jgi:hypothetical protein
MKHTTATTTMALRSRKAGASAADKKRARHQRSAAALAPVEKRLSSVLLRSSAQENVRVHFELLEDYFRMHALPATSSFCATRSQLADSEYTVDLEKVALEWSVPLDCLEFKYRGQLLSSDLFQRQMWLDGVQDGQMFGCIRVAYDV